METHKYELDIFDWDETANGRPSTISVSNDGTIDGDGVLSKFRATAESMVKLDTAIRSSTGRHYVDGMIYFPLTKTEGGALPVVVVRAVGERAFSNEILLGSDNGKIKTELQSYQVALDVLKVLASEASSLEGDLDQLNEGHRKIELIGERLSELGYQLDLRADVRSALQATPYGIFGSSISLLSSIEQPMSFLDLYDAGIVDNVVMEVEILDGEGSKIRRLVKTFSPAFRKVAEEFLAKPQVTGCEHRYASEWQSWDDDMIARIVA